MCHSCHRFNTLCNFQTFVTGFFSLIFRVSVPGCNKGDGGVGHQPSGHLRLSLGWRGGEITTEGVNPLVT
jgi:hypothetical protein